MRKDQRRINNFFAQNGQNGISYKEVDKEIEELEKELKKGSHASHANSDEYLDKELEELEKEVENESKNQL